MSFNLSVLDQSPVRQGGNASQALTETVELARHVDRLGYKRFWVSEHHSTASLAGSSPEVLLGALGNATEHIQIGSGGVMLPHYSAHKVAENFAVLCSLYPGRVDLGVGRAPGGQMEVAQALAPFGGADFRRFPQQVVQLMQAFQSADYAPQITPVATHLPKFWMLGSSPESAMLAAELALPYSFALFINSEMSSAIFKIYRSRYEEKWAERGDEIAKPYTSLAVNVVCADTEEKALSIAKSREVLFLKFLKQEKGLGVPPEEEAEKYIYSAQELEFLSVRREMSAVGSPEQVRDKLTKMASEFGADEIMAVTITHTFSDRLKSYDLLMQALA